MVALVLFWVTRHDEEQGRQQGRDPEVYALQMSLQYSWMPADAKKRAQEAMAKYRNDTLDPEPILIVATLGRSTGIDQVYLHLMVFDECEDLLGFVVREERHAPDGTQSVFEERYPVFTYSLMHRVADVLSIPVHIRDEHQRKDEERWTNYCDTLFPAHTEESMRSEKVPRGNPVPATHWEDTLPPVWISIPEPNNVVVSLYVYAKGGYRSNQVGLLNRLRE
jgi:hypothetical protein